jgi:hypothetical protein
VPDYQKAGGQRSEAGEPVRRMVGGRIGEAAKGAEDAKTDPLFVRTIFLSLSFCHFCFVGAIERGGGDGRNMGAEIWTGSDIYPETLTPMPGRD